MHCEDVTFTKYPEVSLKNIWDYCSVFYIKQQCLTSKGHTVQIKSKNVPDHFLRASAMLKHVLAIGCLSVCHTLVLCRNGSTYHQTVFTAW